MVARERYEHVFILEWPLGFLMQGAWHGDHASQIGAQGWEPRQEHISGRIGEIFPPEAGRFHLIVCPGCPLSHRVSIVHRLKRLEDVVTTSLVRPVMGPNGREFGDANGPAPDPVTGHRYLHQLYTATRPDYSGRDSTPVLWDRHSRQIVSNTYRDILAMLNGAFDAFTASDLNVQPAAAMKAIDRELAGIGVGLSGAVYKCGFSRDQAEYEKHAGMLDRFIPALAARLAGGGFLLGPSITEPDLAVFASLVRYDAIYLPLFRCTRQRIEDHPALTAYIRRMLAVPGVAETFDLSLTMTHYYGSHVHINPTRIVPLAPRMGWHDA